MAELNSFLFNVPPGNVTASPPGVPRTLFELVVTDDALVLTGYTGNIHTVDKHGFNALMVAAMHRCPNALTWGIRKGVGRANIDKEERTEGLTPLMFACISWSSNQARTLDDPTCAQILIEAGANPLKQNVKGDTALHWAVNGEFQAIVAYLVSLDYEVDGVSVHERLLSTRNINGFAPIDLARNKGNEQLVGLLVRACSQLSRDSPEISWGAE
jgi:hypothetical protein